MLDLVEEPFDHKLLQRVRRIRGQVEAIERALDEEIGCAELRRAFPDVPEFKMLVIQEASRAAARRPHAGN